MASWRLKHPSTLAAIYALNGNALDGTGRYPGTLVNTPTWGTFLTGRGCIELDGNNQHVNCGDVAELNAVSAFSICFWMAQDALDQTNMIFDKEVDTTHEIQIAPWVDGEMYFEISDGAAGGRGHFDYSTVISAANWHHVAMVFDGGQAANASRLVVYVDAVPMTLAFIGTIPATSPDLSGQDVTIGTAANSFDGKLYDYRVYSGAALSRDEVRQVIDVPVPFAA